MNTESSPEASMAFPRTTVSIKAIGVGGGGLNSVRALVPAALEGVVVAAVDTDAKHIEQAGIGETVVMGARLTRGLGTGSDPDIGRAAAESEVQALRALCAGHEVVVLLAGLGGGTGSGAAPVVARLARESGALVLALVTLPFDFEGKRRQQQAQSALKQLKTASDAVICLPNQKVAGLLDANTTFVDTFKSTNLLLVQAVCGIWRLLTREAMIKVDFADLARVVRGRQAESVFATAEAAGENRCREVIECLQQSPLLDQGRWLGEADAVLVSLVGGRDMTLKETQQLMEQLNRSCEKADVIMGASVDPSMSGRLSVTLVAAKRVAPEATVSDAAEPVDSVTETGATQFPIPGTRPAEASGEPEAATRSTARFVATPPALPPEKIEELFSRQGAGGGPKRRRGSSLRQGMLPLEVVSKGRFAKSEPTIHRGEDLDTPTYIRRGVPLN